MPMRVLFVCTANAARSQMAEALLQKAGGDSFDAHSAGTSPHGQVHPLAVRVLSRVDIDIWGRKPKSIHQFRGQKFDHVITLADDARDATAAAVVAEETIHWSVDDPLQDPTELGFIEVMKQLRRRVELFATVARQRLTPSGHRGDP